MSRLFLRLYLYCDKFIHMLIQFNYHGDIRILESPNATPKEFFLDLFDQIVEDPSRSFQFKTELGSNIFTFEEKKYSIKSLEERKLLWDTERWKQKHSYFIIEQFLGKSGVFKKIDLSASQIYDFHINWLEAICGSLLSEAHIERRDSLLRYKYNSISVDNSEYINAKAHEYIPEFMSNLSLCQKLFLKGIFRWNQIYQEDMDNNEFLSPELIREYRIEIKDLEDRVEQDLILFRKKYYSRNKI